MLTLKASFTAFFFQSEMFSLVVDLLKNVHDFMTDLIDLSTQKSEENNENLAERELVLNLVQNRCDYIDSCHLEFSKLVKSE
jgi:hypothetical protein